jgi:hypothetical protein
MPNRPSERVSAEEIAERADRGEDVSSYFTNNGRKVEPIQRVNVDFTRPMVDELDRLANELNVSRQAVIKFLVRESLDRRYFASRSGRRSEPDGRARSDAGRKTVKT